MENKVGRSRFFQEIFLVTDTKFKVVLEMLFLKISNANMSFSKGTFMSKFYTTNKVLPTTKHIHIVDSKKFVLTVLNVDNKIFVVHIVIRK